MITKVHPEWQGTTLGILNYELPAKKGTQGALMGLSEQRKKTMKSRMNF